jgi:L-cysteine:1D-myo-inositol 2-amino-2-deoxy-alpha-D-glucopyranoside ligase
LTVRYVQNVTDIDDDILRKAAEVGVDWRALGNRWTSHFIRDMQILNVRRRTSTRAPATSSPTSLPPSAR